MPASIGVNLRVTGHCCKGGRRYMEDFFSVAYQQTEDEKDLEYAFFGIYDGHGGCEAASYAKEHLMESIVRQKNFWSDNDEDVLRAIRDGYISTHYAMWKEQVKWPKTASGLPSTAGTTATIAFIRHAKIYIGHVGDSAVVLGYEDPSSPHWQAEQLTKDHKPENEAEKQRIVQCGGQVISKSGVPRVVWNRPRVGHQGPVRRSTPIDQIPFLAVARSLGDLWSYNSALDEFIVSPDPDTRVININTNTFKCLIFGSDGLWNMVDPKTAVQIVQSTEMHNEFGILHNSPSTSNEQKQSVWINPSKRLVEFALDRWCKTRMRADNTTAVTLLLDPPGPPRVEVLKNQRTAPHTPQSIPIVRQIETPVQQRDDINVMLNAIYGPYGSPLPTPPYPQNGLAIVTRYIEENPKVLQHQNDLNESTQCNPNIKPCTPIMTPRNGNSYQLITKNVENSNNLDRTTTMSSTNQLNKAYDSNPKTDKEPNTPRNQENIQINEISSSSPDDTIHDSAKTSPCKPKSTTTDNVLSSSYNGVYTRSQVPNRLRSKFLKSNVTSSTDNKNFKSIKKPIKIDQRKESEKHYSSPINQSFEKVETDQLTKNTTTTTTTTRILRNKESLDSNKVKIQQKSGKPIKHPTNDIKFVEQKQLENKLANSTSSSDVLKMVNSFETIRRTRSMESIQQIDENKKPETTPENGGKIKKKDDNNKIIETKQVESKTLKIDVNQKLNKKEIEQKSNEMNVHNLRRLKEHTTKDNPQIIREHTKSNENIKELNVNEVDEDENHLKQQQIVKKQKSNEEFVREKKSPRKPMVIESRIGEIRQHEKIERRFSLRVKTPVVESRIGEIRQKLIFPTKFDNKKNFFTRSHESKDVTLAENKSQNQNLKKSTRGNSSQMSESKLTENKISKFEKNSQNEEIQRTRNKSNLPILTDVRITRSSKLKESLFKCKSEPVLFKKSNNERENVTTSRKGGGFQDKKFRKDVPEKLTEKKKSDLIIDMVSSNKIDTNFRKTRSFTSVNVESNVENTIFRKRRNSEYIRINEIEKLNAKTNMIAKSTTKTPIKKSFSSSNGKRQNENFFESKVTRSASKVVVMQNKNELVETKFDGKKLKLDVDDATAKSRICIAATTSIMEHNIERCSQNDSGKVMDKELFKKIYNLNEKSDLKNINLNKKRLRSHVKKPEIFKTPIGQISPPLKKRKVENSKNGKKKASNSSGNVVLQQAAKSVIGKTIPPKKEKLSPKKTSVLIKRPSRKSQRLLSSIKKRSGENNKSLKSKQTLKQIIDKTLNQRNVARKSARLLKTSNILKNLKKTNQIGKVIIGTVKNVDKQLKKKKI